jgi:hypothetical protein
VVIAEFGTGAVAFVAMLAKLLGRTDTPTTEFYFQVRDQRSLQAARSLRLHVRPQTG